MSAGLRPQLQSPPIEARSFATGTTAAASAVASLAELANDAAGGHPAQRMTLGKIVNDGATFDRFASTYYIASGAARFLRVCFEVESAYSAGLQTWLTMGLTIQDSAGNTVASASSAIPYGLKNDVDYSAWFNGASAPRFASGQRPVLWLDVEALITAGLVAASAPWRFAWTISMHDAYAFLRGLQVEERSTFLIDEAEPFGQLPGDYRPRDAVVDGTPGGLQRLWQTVRPGLMANLRTYHGMARADTDPWLVSATSFAAFGSDTVNGAAAAYRVRGRRMRGTTACPVRWCILYKFSGGSAAQTGTVKLTTGTGSTTVTVTWADNTTWYTSALVTGASLDNTTTHDELVWTGEVSTSGPILQIAARYVFDDPSP
jgi:hypothetical protein